jgi:alginate O-acetyltransferase complex protein AlgI
MVFSSPLFLFFFLPALILLYFCTPKQFKNVLLLVASLLFYAWGEGFYVALMLISIGLNYVFGRLIDVSDNSRRYLAIGVVANLGILVSYKYSNFIIDNLNSVLNFFAIPSVELAPVHLPLGISFFTFQAISYLIDIHRKEIISQTSVVKLGLYISLFPQLIAGPIVRYKTIIAEIDSRRTSSTMFAEGAERFVYGLAKKMLIANPLGYVVDVIFDLPLADLPTHVVWMGILFYALQIYFDFSAYSDMAIGLGRMFGFRFLENFNYPYSAQSLQDFWRRWHISLSTWFRDYLYIPLGGNRLSELRTYANLFIVFVLCGLWHGASWNFFVWGVFHGAILSIERVGLSRLIEQLWSPLRHLYLIIVVLVSWVFFRAETLTDAITYLTSMFSINFNDVPFEVLDAINVEVIFALVFGMVLSAPVYRRWFISAGEGVRQADSLSAILILLIPYLRCAIVSVLLFLSAMSLASTTHNPFIYFRF